MFDKGQKQSSTLSCDSSYFRCNAALILARDPFLLESWNFSTIVGQLTESVESSFLIHQNVYHDLSVCS